MDRQLQRRLLSYNPKFQKTGKLPYQMWPGKSRPKRKPEKKKKAPKKRGKKRLRREFDQTKLGYGLRLYAPLEYDIIMRSSVGAPDPDLVEAVSYSSNNPFFRSVRFRRWLIEYRKNGLHIRVPMKPPSVELMRWAVKWRNGLLSNS